MAKPSHREKILCEGLKLVHERGFAGASVRDIVQAAGVPQGSFTNHFASKEAFALEIIELYFADAQKLLNETLRNEALPPLERLAAYVEAASGGLTEQRMKTGCLFGNFSAEATESSETIRLRLAEIFGETEKTIAACLTAAVATGDLPRDYPCADVAGFIVSSMQGVSLVCKALRSPAPMEQFKRVVFDKILR